MFKHEKTLFHPISIKKPNPQYAALLQGQLGGAISCRHPFPKADVTPPSFQ